MMHILHYYSYDANTPNGMLDDRANQNILMGDLREKWGTLKGLGLDHMNENRTEYPNLVQRSSLERYCMNIEGANHHFSIRKI